MVLVGVGEQHEVDRRAMIPPQVSIGAAAVLLPVAPEGLDAVANQMVVDAGLPLPSLWLGFGLPEAARVEGRDQVVAQQAA